MLHFGLPSSDYIALTVECAPRSGHGSIGMPSFGKAVISLSSGSVSQTFPAKITKGTEGYEDSVNTLKDVRLDQPLWKNFQLTGELSAADPARDFTAATPAEKAEIQSFFSACTGR